MITWSHHCKFSYNLNRGKKVINQLLLNEEIRLMQIRRPKICLCTLTLKSVSNSMYNIHSFAWLTERYIIKYIYIWRERIGVIYKEDDIDIAVVIKGLCIRDMCVYIHIYIYMEREIQQIYVYVWNKYIYLVQMKEVCNGNLFGCTKIHNHPCHMIKCITLFTGLIGYFWMKDWGHTDGLDLKLTTSDIQIS